MSSPLCVGCGYPCGQDDRYATKQRGKKGVHLYLCLECRRDYHRECGKNFSSRDEETGRFDRGDYEELQEENCESSRERPVTFGYRHA
jgi:hypothetical protein